MTEKDNIVMVSWDSVRSDHLPTYGYERNTTPFVAEHADDALVFENTHASAVGTPASFTGVFSGEHASGSMLSPDPGHWKRANADRDLLSEYLQNEGYYTGAFHQNALMSHHFGWDRGWDVYEDHLWTEGDEGEALTDDANWRGRLFEFLQERDMATFATHLKKMLSGESPATWEAMWPDIEAFVEDAPEPWFLWVLLIDTHHPYYPPRSAQEWPQPGVRSTYAWNYAMRRHRDLVGERRDGIVNAYDNTLRYADQFVERLTGKLEEEGYGDAPFVFHSDHGDEFGEHVNYGHRPTMYDTVTRVPLMMWNVGETGRREGPHTLLDLGNAVLDIAGSDARLGQGRSLLDADDERERVVVQNLLNEYGKAAAVVDEEWKVLYHPHGDWGQGRDIEGYEAYRVSDVLERDDRLGEEPEASRELLETVLSEDAAEIDAGDEGIDADVQERLSELGYVE